MDCNFSTLCADQLDRVRKRLDSLNAKFINEYEIALNVINSPGQHEHRKEIMCTVEKVLSNAVERCDVLYMEAMRHLKSELVRFI